MDYKKAGVDIEAGYRSVELMKEHVAKTMRPEVLGGIGRILRCIFHECSLKIWRNRHWYPEQTDVGTKVKTCHDQWTSMTPVGIDCGSYVRE